MDAYEKRSRARQLIAEAMSKNLTFVEIREEVGNRYGFGEKFCRKMMNEIMEYQAATK